MKKITLLVLVAALLVALGLGGCSDKNTNVTQQLSGSVGSQGSMIGTVEGLLIDASTNQPIVGAVVDIGVAKAVTTENGQFVLNNVPATQSRIITNPIPGAAGNETVTTSYLQQYQVTINMKGVTSPVAMTSASATPRYSDFEFRTLDVHYETIANLTTSGTGSASSETFITNVQDVSNVMFTAGKLAATIRGYVAGCYADDFFASKGMGYTVSIVPAGAWNNTGTAQTDNVIATANTDGNGSFTFSNIESQATFWICAQDANGTMFGCADGNAGTLPAAPNFRPGDADMDAVTSPRDGETLVLNIQNSNAVHVCPTDAHGPVVTKTAPENGSDITPGTTNVVFTFSEPILQTARTVVDSTTPGGGGNTLYDQIEVRFEGTKAGNVAYTAAWTANNELTVTFDTAASGKYFVRLPAVITGAAGSILTDDVGNPAGMGVCADDSKAPAMYNTAGDVDNDDCTVWFTTNGGATADPPAISLMNSAQMNYNGLVGSNIPDIDWLPVSGAKAYKVYGRQNQVFSDPTSTAVASTNNHNYELLTATPITATAWSPVAGLNFVENNVTKYTYDYYVTSVNSDGSESGPSNVLNVQDTVKPRLTPALTFNKATTTEPNTITDPSTMVLTFNEPMREWFVENGTYTILTRNRFSTPNIDTVRLISPTTARITFSQLDLAITAGTGGVCTYTYDAADTRMVASTDVSSCIAAGPNNVRDTLNAGDDVLCGTASICAGPNGICDTAVAGDDIAVIAQNGVAACISEGATPGLQTVLTAANDDELCPGSSGLAICPGVNGICDQVAAVGDLQRTNVGTALPFFCAVPGADGVLDSTGGNLTSAVQAITVSGVVDVSNNGINTNYDMLNVTNNTAAGTVN